MNVLLQLNHIVIWVLNSVRSAQQGVENVVIYQQLLSVLEVPPGVYNVSAPQIVKQKLYLSAMQQVHVRGAPLILIAIIFH